MKSLFTIAMVFSAAASMQNIQASENIKGVTICAAECYSESLNIRGHNESVVGIIYYAKATKDNMSNTNVCISESKPVEVISNRLSDKSIDSCLDAITGKYYGKKVNMIPNKISEEGEDGVYFSIEAAK